MTEFPTPGSTPTEPKALRHYLEHLTFISLWLAVSLYFIGQIQSWKFLQSFQIPNLGADHTWEAYVFLGAVALINEVPNLLLAPSLQVLKWVLPLLCFTVSLWAWKRVPASKVGFARRLGRMVLLTVSGLAYLTFLVALGAGWGSRSAQLFKTTPRAPERFVISAEWQAQLPKALQEANARGTLQQITSSPELLFVYDPAQDTTYAVPSRLILCRVYEPGLQPRR